MVESSGTGKGSTRGNEDPSVARTPRLMEGRVNSSATPGATGQPHSLYQETTSGHTLTSHRECCSIDTCVRQLRLWANSYFGATGAAQAGADL